MISCHSIHNLTKLCSITQLKKLFEMHTPARAAVPTDGDARVFSISVHSRSNLSAAEKLVYLQQALKGGPARSTIEGLSRSGDNYDEAVCCLKAKYDCPR